MKNIDYFNQAVGIVFEQLYSAFPVPIAIDEAAIAEKMGAVLIDSAPPDWPAHAPRIVNMEPFANGVDPRQIIFATLMWLEAEGFTSAKGDFSCEDVVLTAKALAAMNASPASLKQTLGAKLSDAVKASSSEAGKAAISETVGQIIGAAVRGFTG